MTTSNRLRYTLFFAVAAVTGCGSSGTAPATTGSSGTTTGASTTGSSGGTTGTSTTSGSSGSGTTSGATGTTGASGSSAGTGSSGTVAALADAGTDAAADGSTGGPIWTSTSPELTFISEVTYPNSVCGPVAVTYTYIHEQRSLSALGCDGFKTYNGTVILAPSVARDLDQYLFTLEPTDVIDCNVSNFGGSVFSVHSILGSETVGNTDYRPACADAGPGPFLSSLAFLNIQIILNDDFTGCGDDTDAGAVCTPWYPPCADVDASVTCVLSAADAATE